MSASSRPIRNAPVSRRDRPGRARARQYNLYRGAAFDGSRLNKLYRKDVGHDEIVAALTPLIEPYARERDAGERFGNFVIRKGYATRTTSGRDFHANLSFDLAV